VNSIKPSMHCTVISPATLCSRIALPLGSTRQQLVGHGAIPANRGRVIDAHPLPLRPAHSTQILTGR